MDVSLDSALDFAKHLARHLFSSLSLDPLACLLPSSQKDSDDMVQSNMSEDEEDGEGADAGGADNVRLLLTSCNLDLCNTFALLRAFLLAD